MKIQKTNNLETIFYLIRALESLEDAYDDALNEIRYLRSIVDEYHNEDDETVRFWNDHKSLPPVPRFHLE